MLKNGSDIELITAIKNGDKEALEKFFESKLCFMRVKAGFYTKKYRDISNDYEEYFNIIYESCLKAIKIFDEAKGDFLHLWMKIVKREIIRFLKKTTIRNDNMKILNYDTISETSNNFCEAELDDYFNQCRDIIDFINKKDIYDKTQEFLNLNFSHREKDMFTMWLDGFSFKEISRKYSLNYSTTVSKIYNIVDMLKYKFNN